MIIMDGKEVFPILCKRCDKTVAAYVYDEDLSLNATAFCVRCVTREQGVIKRNDDLSSFFKSKNVTTNSL